MKKRVLTFFTSTSLCSLLVSTVLTACLFPYSSQAQVPSYVPTSGLVGYWPFNGNANDESGNGNNGTVNGATLTTDRNGLANKAYSFDGVDDYIQCAGGGPTGNPTISCSFWLKTNSTNYGHIIGYGGNSESGRDFRVYINGGCQGSIDFDTYDNLNSKSSSFINTWDFYTIIYNGSIGNNTTVASFYKNGTLLSNTCFSVNLSTTNISNLIPIFFGKYHGSLAGNLPGFLLGELDDIGIWNRALSAQEISNLYTGTTPVSCLPSYVPTNGLVGYWPFCGNADDESGNANHGTVNGATLTTDRFGNADKAYSFDGVNDFISLSDYPTSNNQSFSIFSWVQTPYLGTRRQIIGYGSNNILEGAWLYVGNDSLLHFDLSLTNGPVSTLQVGDNSWHFVGVTNNSGLIQLFVDGVSSGVSLSMSPNIQTGGKTIGSSIINDNWFFNGNIDDIGIWNRALTPCEIADLYHAQVGSANTSSTQTQEACVSYSWNGTTYTQSGQYIFQTTNALGCDSTATLNLAINQPTTSTTSHTACSSYSWNGTTYTQSGQYTFHTTNAHGCDSTATLNLTINQPTTSTTSHTACSSYSWNGTTYTQSGQYTFLTTNAHGCDSTATLNLTINQPTTSSTSHEACGSYSWNGTTYTQSGQYTFHTTNAHGCDSTATLNLTINQPTTSTTSHTACGSYSWNGTTYTQSGQYTFLTTNAHGCDSTATLNLTINQPTTSSTSHAACGSYSWNGNTYVQSGQYTFLTTNAQGCDSTAILHLTINQPTASTQTQTALDSYTWPVNGQTYTQSGSYSAVIPNAAGCDSTITLNLTLNFTGLEELQTNAIKLYPNPSSDLITLELANELVGQHFMICNELGQVVLEGKLSADKMSVKVGEFAPGTYVFKSAGGHAISFSVIRE